jgi:hypothetical protein
MTLDEIKDWALEHGFSDDGNGRLSQPYGDTVISIEVLRRNVRVFQSRGEQEVKLISGHPGHAFVNEHGVLEGIGLSASFLARCDRGPGSVPPPWMGQDYLDAVGWGGEPAAPPAPAGPR